MSRAINAKAAPPQAGPYSHAVQTGNLVFLAGQGPFDPAGGPRPETFEEQARLTFRNLAAVAEAAGGSLADAVRVGVYLHGHGRLRGDEHGVRGVLHRALPRPHDDPVEYEHLDRGRRGAGARRVAPVA